ncbi:MAG: hypothetical protein R2864_08835 [Syntrophotaleaceae bacterium]
MSQSRTIYVNEKWEEFSERVKRRDGYKCMQCERTEGQVVLQIHHERYISGKPPWEYPLSDCRTLCRGCHARAHGLLEPARGWTLISIDDLGGLDGECERDGCGKEIRYAHHTYHPSWGYKTVGSTCIEHLTKEDKLLSSEIIKHYKAISKFVASADWDTGFTQNRQKFIFSKHNHHIIRIYGKEQTYSFQLAIKEKGIHWWDYGKSFHHINKNLDQVKELAFIALKGTIAKKSIEKTILRQIYKKLM